VNRLVRGARARFARSFRHEAAGVAAGIAAVGAVTGLVYLLRPYTPELSLGILYVLAVLPVAVVWGRAHAAGVAVASMLIFNFLFLPPIHALTLSGEENWLKLAVMLVTGLLVAELASRARQRARDAEQREREAALLAELSTVLLSGAAVESELVHIAEGTARILGVPSAGIELGTGTRPGLDRRGTPLPLRSHQRRVGTLHVPAGATVDSAAADRFLPALASLLAVAVERERLQHEALEAEALRRSDSMKTALLRAVSHDLRSPITAIRVAVEGLESPALTLDQQDRVGLLETVRLEVERLDRVVGNLLDLSRLQAGAAQPRRALRSLDGIVVQALAGLVGHERVEVALPTDLSLVDVDAAQIERVLVNLLDNALKFSPPGSAIRVHARAMGDQVVVRVDDEGPGVPAAELERIFEPFRHTAGQVGRKGTGLGLAIARGFAEANGGRLFARQRPGGGASFVLELPAAAAVPVPA
jgi:two-component system sensor histidine kinase KdpD